MKLQGHITYPFSGTIWKHHADKGWYFVSLPKHLSQEIRENLQWQEEGWGRLKATAMVNGIKWDTAIWFDKKHDTYLLPLKADIRKKANLQVNDSVSVAVLV